MTRQFVDLNGANISAVAAKYPAIILFNSRALSLSARLLILARNSALPSFGRFSLKRRLCDAYRNLSREPVQMGWVE